MKHRKAGGKWLQKIFEKCYGIFGSLCYIPTPFMDIAILTRQQRVRA
jgi:hypothetical protein